MSSVATLQAELALVETAIAAVLNRKGVKSYSVRGRSLTNMSLQELNEFRNDLTRMIERATTTRSIGVMHGVAQRQK